MKNILLVFLFFLLFSCENKRLDTAKIAQQISDSKIKRVSDLQVMALADARGKSIASILQTRLAESLQSTHLKDSLAIVFGVKIIFVAIQKAAFLNKEPKIQEVIEAYQYSLKHKMVLSDNLQKFDNGLKLCYTTPLIVNKQLHNASAAQLKLIEAKTGLDSLSFRKRGETLGLWCIYFSKKEIIRRITIKELKSLEISESKI